MGLFEKVTRKTNAPSSKNFFFFFLERFGNLGFFFFFFFVFKKNIYIHEQSTSNATWIFRIQRNIETWNKLTNFKLNHDVANQMWSEAKLGHLLLLGPFRMLETRYAWTLIMIKCLGLALGRLEPWLWSFGICLKWLDLTLHACILWAFGLWSWLCVYTFDGLKCWA